MSQGNATSKNVTTRHLEPVPPPWDRRWCMDGGRFRKLGDLYASFVNGPGKAYTAGNDALRNLSTALIQDWVEKMIFSSPVLVDDVVRAVAASVVLGTTPTTIDNDQSSSCSKHIIQLEPRRQGFYSLWRGKTHYPCGYSLYRWNRTNRKGVTKL